jgi:hypothetical protein
MRSAISPRLAISTFPNTSEIRHCEERSDEAISNRLALRARGCFASLAMTLFLILFILFRDPSSRNGRALAKHGRHCEERSDEAISIRLALSARDCFAALAMTRFIFRCRGLAILD